MVGSGRLRSQRAWVLGLKHTDNGLRGTHLIQN